ncbi:MAG: HD domain-containing phosphohydrolase [Halanaerobiaceae bacterium]
MSKNNIFLKGGLAVAHIFSSQPKSQKAFGQAAKGLYYHLGKDVIEHVRFYEADENRNKYREQALYSSNGLEPGNDAIPSYQLPDNIVKNHDIEEFNEDNYYFLLIPLVHEEDIVGLLELKLLDPLIDNRRQIRQMAHVITLGLSQSISKDNNRRSNEMTDIAIDINNSLQSITEMDELILAFLKITIKKFHFDRATFFLFDQEGNIDRIKGITEMGYEYIPDSIPELPEIKKDGYALMRGMSGYLFALTTNTRQVGLILFDNIYSLYNLTEQAIITLKIVCSQFASTMDNIRLLTDLKWSAYNDRLTGLYNRLYFNLVLNNYDLDGTLPNTIIVGDVNGLKITNDVFGHHAGDELLISISNILTGCTDAEDMIFRWGGDEFFIILPKTTEEEGRKIYKDIKEACSSQKNFDIKLSISLGLATRTSVEEDIRDIIVLAEDRMYRHKLMETKHFKSSLIKSLKETLDVRCSESKRHTEKMSDLCVKLGKEIGLSPNNIDDLRMLGMLHDIGKVAVNEKILNKPGPLTETEWEEVKKHAETGYRIAQSSLELSSIANYILFHHERWDGQGYPLGKKGNEIPLISRIVTVVDAYDVMTHENSYSSAMTHQEAMEELLRCSGQQFDPKVVERFIKVIEKEKK